MKERTLKRQVEECELMITTLFEKNWIGMCNRKLSVQVTFPRRLF